MNMEGKRWEEVGSLMNVEQRHHPGPPLHENIHFYLFKSTFIFCFLTLVAELNSSSWKENRYTLYSERCKWDQDGL